MRNDPLENSFPATATTRTGPPVITGLVILIAVTLLAGLIGVPLVAVVFLWLAVPAVILVGRLRRKL